jgi:membrane-associated phospholipid phosphatase
MRASTRAKLTIAAVVPASLVSVTPALAQHAASSLDPARSDFWWAGGVLVGIAALSDAALERSSLAHRSRTLDDLESAGNVLGSGRYLVPALAAGYLAGWLTHEPRVRDGALHAAAAYTLGNVVTSLGKPVLGRHRPDTTGSPWRFRPFAKTGAWHSLPSAHTLHAFTLAGAVSEEARRPWVTAVAYGAATIVAWSRVYRDEHWASDVALSSVVGAAIGHATVRVMHARADRHR